MGTFDSMLVKYGAVMVGYAILGLPVFGPGSEEYLLKVGSDPSAITRDYVRNSSLLINLAKAIGRLVVSYKEIQELAGYTTVVSEVRDVLLDLNKGKLPTNLSHSHRLLPPLPSSQASIRDRWWYRHLMSSVSSRSTLHSLFRSNKARYVAQIYLEPIQI